MSDRTAGSGGAQIERFTFAERALHWAVALAFVYVALSGLALWTPGLYWIAAVLGGGELVRWAHPWGGVVFVLVLLVMFGRWAGPMRLDRDDRRWLRRAHRYAMHDTKGLPEAGRFNGGQKALFWTQVLAAAMLLGSGIVLWFPGSFGRGWIYAALLVHPVAALVSIGGIIVHFYMATLAVPGSLHAMLRGRVSADWADAHHPKWYREISRR